MEQIYIVTLSVTRGDNSKVIVRAEPANSPEEAIKRANSHYLWYDDLVDEFEIESQVILLERGSQELYVSDNSL